MLKYFCIALLICSNTGNIQMLNNFKLYFERSGGFAGMLLKVEFYSSDLPTEEKEKLIALLDNARFFELNTDTVTANSHPDQFQYKISIENKDSTHTVLLAENQVPENWRPLIQYLSRRARMPRK